MQFKVGDRVRGTRNCFISMAQNKIIPEEILIKGFEIKEIRDGIAFFDADKGHYENDLELVPEEPEFEYGEEIEVRNHEEERRKRIFFAKLSSSANHPYVCVHGSNNNEFKRGERVYTEQWKYARKRKSKLTRQEIAEKFGIPEDFTLID